VIGKTISHYKILEKIGGGGMGIVYKAQDLKLDRIVALKFLPPHLTTSDEEKLRFIHEAKAASSLDHNNICNIYEIDETEDGQLFISMAYYEGETLDKKIKDKPLPVEDAIIIALQIGQGLTKSHEKEIVHRDIKPGNIMITVDGVVKILDFGLAKLSTQTKLTKVGTTLGTIAYMSPEQARGDTVDARSDIWSLGVILYEMIAGQVPFKGDYDQAVMYAITSETPELISGLRTGVPLELERIVNRCISKDPQGRYQHADDLLSELKKLEKEADTWPVKQKHPKKKKLSTILLPISILILILLITGYLLLKSFWLDRRELSTSEWENSIAVLPFSDLSPEKNQEYFCDGMTEQIITNLSKIKRLKVIARTSVMTYKNKDIQIPEIGKELSVAHILEGSIRKFGDQIRVTAQLVRTNDGAHLWAEDYDRQLDHVFEVQDDVAQKIASNLFTTLSIGELKELQSDRPNNIHIYDQYIRAKEYHYKFLRSQNVEDLYAAISLLKDILQQEQDYLSAIIELANVYNTYYNHFADTDEEKKIYIELQKKYIEIAEHHNANSMEFGYIRFLVSLAEYEENWYYIHIDFLKDYPNHPRVNWSFGQNLYGVGLAYQSLPYIEKAMQLDPLGLWHCLMRARTYFMIGQYEKAELYFQDALKIDPDDYWTYLRYTHYLISFRRAAEAESLMTKWEKIKPYDTALERNRAYLFAIQGETRKAISHFNQTISDTEKNPYLEQSVLYLLSGDLKQAIENIIESENQFTATGQSYSRYLRYLNYPYYKILHDNPRFQEILSKHKEIYEENRKKYGDIE
jgi:serine/threonine protein kinase